MLDALLILQETYESDILDATEVAKKIIINNLQLQQN
jgi:hypothetical protein